MNFIKLDDACNYLSVPKVGFSSMLREREKSSGTQIILFSEAYDRDFVIKKELVKLIESGVKNLLSQAKELETIRAEKDCKIPIHLKGCYVYFLFNKSDLIYVGQSEDALGRIATHSKDKEKIFDAVSLIKCEKADLFFLEALHIHRHKPPLNRSGGWLTLIRRAVETIELPID